MSASSAHGGAKKAHDAHAPAASSEDGDHCDAEKNKTAQAKSKPVAEKAATAYGEEQGNSLSVSALYAPCSRDCCAVASSSVQPRRGRDSALASQSGNLSPPAFVPLSLYSLNLQPTAYAYLKRLRGRAPPLA
ncbi:MAG: hypothetical protein ICV60_10255 [Pyrinomonadaceae bacterium]|nr:hypothetical protein [Pyrinomonadaceae bacterium]